MTQLFDPEGFEGGTLGNAVNAGNTTADTLDTNGGTGVFASTAVEGDQSFRVATTASARYCLLWSHSAAGVAFYRWYYYLENIGSANVITFALRSGATVAQQTQVRGSGGNVVRIFNGGDAAATSTETIPASQWVRFELRINGSTDEQELRVYWGANLHGTTANITLSGAFTAVNTVNDARVGLVAAAASTDQYFDAVASDDADWVGPLSVPGQLDTPANLTWQSVTGLREIDGDWDDVAGAASYELEVQEATSIGGPWTPLSPDDVFTPTSSEQSIDHTDGVTWARFYRARARAMP